MKIEKLLNKKDAIVVRREIKKMIGADAHLPVFITDRIAAKGPVVIGSSLRRGFYTLGGERIHHPSAYAKKGFSNMEYIRDPRFVEVGIEWLKRFAGTAAFVK